MTAQQLGTQAITIVPAAAILARRAVTWSDAQAGAGAAGVGVEVKGFADHEIEAGTPGRLIYGITAIAESGAAIDGTKITLKTNADGRLIPTAATTDVVAAILKNGQTATAAGQPIEVYTYHNVTALA